jgi:predicted NAD/FAD-dependent oxidoreductase
MTPTLPSSAPAEALDLRSLSLGKPPSAVVVGAGVAGLTCASLLAAQRFRVRVFDKGRRPGGRVSTRREGEWIFDHGAQYFTAQHPAFEARLEDWLARGAVAIWEGRIRVLSEGRVTLPKSVRVRYVGVPGMSSLARWLAGPCRVQTGVRVARLEHRRGHWYPLDDGGGELGRFDLAVVAVPPPQAAELLTAAPPLRSRAQAVRMLPTWAALLGFPTPLGLPFDGAFVHGSALSWAAHNGSKPGREEGECWVLHASHRWSHEHLEEPPGRVAEALFDALRGASGQDLPRPVFQTAHRWRWAAPEIPFPDRCFLDEERGLGVCGDWCGGPRVEGAFLSGRALARRMTDVWGSVGFEGGG